jgi:hypothetical protein
MLLQVAWWGEPHKGVYVDPIGSVRRYPSRGSMGMKEIPFILQLTHRVADSRRRYPEAELPGDRLAPGRLSSLDIRLDNRFEHPQLPLTQLFRRWHSVEI